MNNYYAGHFAETVALWFLRCKGYHLVAKNYVTGKGTHAGEVDLIVRRGKTLVFAEVKKRKSHEVAAYAIVSVQQARIRRGAEAFLSSHCMFENFNIRFDAILIVAPFKIQHVMDAF